MAQRSKNANSSTTVIHPGCMVDIVGLTKRPDLNNKTALLIAFIDGKQRYQVLEPDTGKSFLLQRTNIMVNDPILDTISKLSEESLCHCFVEELQQKMGISSKDLQTQQITSNLYRNITKNIAKMSTKQSLMFFDLRGFGHHFVIHIYRSTKVLRYRLFHCWVQENGKGFTVGQHLKSKCFQWNPEGGLKDLCRNLLKLKKTITNLVEQELLECIPESTLIAKRQWALRIKGQILEKGISMQPAQLDFIKSYGESMRKDGYPPRAVIFLGSILRPDELQQIYDFPLSTLQTIMEIGRHLFAADVNADTFIAAVEWHTEPTAWDYSVVKDIEKLKL